MVTSNCREPTAPRILSEPHRGLKPESRLLRKAESILFEVFDPQRVFQAHAAEMFRGKMRNAGKLERFFLREGIADFDSAVIVNTDDIARISFFDIGAILRHKDGGIG